MITAEPRTLTELHRRQTTYEVAITTPFLSMVVGYTARRTKHALLSFARANSRFILDNIPEGEDPEPVYTKDEGWTFGPVRLHFTGRTEREAATDLLR